jgi:hypothetical protein
MRYRTLVRSGLSVSANSSDGSSTDMKAKGRVWPRCSKR